MATVMAGAAISPALGLIAEAFPDASETVIKLILTAPSITAIRFQYGTLAVSVFIVVLISTVYLFRSREVLEASD